MLTLLPNAVKTEQLNNKTEAFRNREENQALTPMLCSAFSCFLGKLGLLSWLQSHKHNSDLLHSTTTHTQYGLRYG